MFKAVCAQCGKDCQVPFKPNGTKPVFCSSCFETNGGGESRGSSFDRPSYDNKPSFSRSNNYESPRFEQKQMFDAVCDKCGNTCQVPFRPTNGKPVFCSNCFDRQDSRSDSRHDSVDSFKAKPVQNNDALDAINAKLDKILKLLKPVTSGEEVLKAEATEKVLSLIEETKAEKIEKPKKAKAAKKVEILEV